ncbi:MAG: DUF4336 domain-containing protein [Synechococcales cyanobacterium RM1_1_8]|nr:DUF4336 domain-containing protein [Synechococcales cyanobacterium RM1_1_8]
MSPPSPPIALPATAARSNPSAFPSQRDRRWPFWPAAPLYPYGTRWTRCQEVIPDQVWTFDQVQGILYVIVPIRMTVVRLAAGGLLVYAPIAPTAECLGQLQALIDRHGPIKYIILPTVSAIEHKVPAGPFAQKFPSAQVYVAPHQWSFPLNLPLSWLGLPGDRTQLLPAHSADSPFAADFDYEILGPIDLKVGPFEEAVFFHRASQTLLVTDSVMSIPAQPPAVMDLDPYPLLFHARDRALDPILDSPARRTKGWQRITLFSFYFRPSALAEVRWGQVLRDVRQASDRSSRAYFGLFPFQWQEHWQQSFETLRNGGQLFVAPVLQKLILNRSPQQVLDWVDRVARWDFTQVIPAHFDAPVNATPAAFRQAFDFLEQRSQLPEQDLALLNQIDQLLRSVMPPPKGHGDQ